MLCEGAQDINVWSSNGTVNKIKQHSRCLPHVHCILLVASVTDYGNNKVHVGYHVFLEPFHKLASYFASPEMLGC